MRGRWRAFVCLAALVAAVLLPATTVVAAAAEPDGACQVSDTGRFADCASGQYSWNIRQANGDVLGTVDVAFTLSEKVSPTSREWSAHWTVYVMSLTGVAESGTTIAVVPECGGACSSGTGLPDDGSVLTPNRVLAGDVRFSSPGTGRDQSTQTMNIYLFHPAALGPGTTYGDPRTTLGPVRCDDGVPSKDGEDAVPGCVLSEHVPTFVLNSPEFASPRAPIHAAFVASAQNDPRTMGHGRLGTGRPLIREVQPDQAAKDAKREQSVCRQGFQRHASPPGTPDSQLDSCDEYPYLSTRQGVPQFAVTAHVPRGDNNSAGGQLGEFYSKYHIEDGDEFYVQP